MKDDGDGVHGDVQEKRDRMGGARRHGVALVVCVVSLPLLIFFASSTADRRPSFDWILSSVGVTVDGSAGSDDKSSPPIFIKSPPRDKSLGGLLATGFDEASCMSRYESALYHKPSPHILSPYLVGRLRKYEALHKKCGPHTELYNKSIEQLKANHSTGPSPECNYVVWLPYNGFGNRVLTLVSAFLYALLNNRVLLIYVPEDFADLLCEPFPKTSWVLPSSDFPIRDLDKFDFATPQSYGNMLRNHVIKNDMRFVANVSLPPYVYLHLEHDYNALDKLFFCEDAQQMLQRFQWQLLKSDNYFVPGLFLVEDYGDELSKLFPQRDVVFHHLGRYLLHPSNVVWGHIMRYYHAHLANADERVGIQIRIFAHRPVPFDAMFAQIMNCSSRENLLPSIDDQIMSPIRTDSKLKLKAVLITTLYRGYFEKLRNMYYEHSTKTGEMVGVYQASHEEVQHTDKQSHNIKAWSEIYLLSFSDVLITSAWSTFGYVAQGLGGLKPWILLRTSVNPDPPCRRAMSTEPCFHSPPSYDCKAHRDVDKGEILRHVRHCEDMEEGLKLVD